MTKQKKQEEFLQSQKEKEEAIKKKEASEDEGLDSEDYAISVGDGGEDRSIAGMDT